MRTQLLAVFSVFGAVLIGSGCTLTPMNEDGACAAAGCGGAGAHGGTGGSGNQGNTGNNPPQDCDEDGDGHNKEGCHDDSGQPDDDCDDTDASVNPDAVEVCGDGIDNDCDRQIDEGCVCTPGDTQACYTGPSDTRGVGECRDGLQACNQNSVWGSCQNQQLPVDEICGNGEDDDCDGQVDEGCTVTDCDHDGDGHNAIGCHDNSGRPEDDCDDNNAAMFPGNTEICGNGIDEDCDGSDLQCDVGINGCPVGVPDVQRSVDVIWDPPANAPLDLDVEVEGGWMQQPGMDPESGDFAQASYDPDDGVWIGHMDLLSGTYLEYTVFHHGTTCDGWVTDQCGWPCAGNGSDFGLVTTKVDGQTISCTHISYDQDYPCLKHIACCIP